VRTIFKFSTENPEFADWLAERGKFELSAPFVELPDDSCE